MKIEITYKSNDELWSMEYLMENHGYTKTADCYWAQIYEDSNGNKIITSRESSTDGDPLDELKKHLEPKEEETDTMKNDTNGAILAPAEMACVWDVNGNTVEPKTAKTPDDLRAIFAAAHAMTRRTVGGSKRPISYSVTFAAALKIAYAEHGKSAAELWSSYSDEEKYNALKAMAGYEYQRRDSRMMKRNGQFVPLANVFTWVNPQNVADDLTAVAHDAYIKVIDYLADERRADWTLSRVLSRAVVIAAQKISRAERRNPSALRHDNEGREFIDTQDQATAEPIAPSPETAAIIIDAINRAARDDTDALIIKARAAGYSAREIAERLGMSHTAINKRIAGIKARYAAA